MRFIDIGVNLMNPAFDRDREAVLAAARLAEVSPLVITGSDIASSEAALAFARAHPKQCWATVGVHPHNAAEWNTDTHNRLRELAAGELPQAGPVAVGECGLDYNRNFSPPDAQRRCFADQLALAAALGKPVFLHERDAFEDFAAILKQFRPNLTGAVVHCFTGGLRELETYLEMDCYIGITGWVCDERRGGHLIPLLAHIPVNRLLLETDAPYLTPRTLPQRPSRNEPRFLPHIAAYIADMLGKPPERLASETYANALRFFNRPEQQGDWAKK